jgi:isoamylase
MRRRFLTGQKSEGQHLPDVTWHGFKLNEPLWEDKDARLLAYTLGGTRPDEEDLHVILNMSEDALELDLPVMPGKVWHLAVDTAIPSPRDISEPSAQDSLKIPKYRVRGRSVVVLEGREPSRP